MVKNKTYFLCVIDGGINRPENYYIMKNILFSNTFHVLKLLCTIV